MKHVLPCEKKLCCGMNDLFIEIADDILNMDIANILNQNAF